MCELCGKENTGVFNILVSGAQISACATCSTKRDFRFRLEKRAELDHQLNHQFLGPVRLGQHSKLQVIFT